MAADGPRVAPGRERRDQLDTHAPAAVLDRVLWELSLEGIDQAGARDAVDAEHPLGAHDKASMVLEERAVEGAVVPQEAVGPQRSEGGDTVLHEDQAVARPQGGLFGRVPLEHDHVVETASAPHRDGARKPRRTRSEDPHSHGDLGLTPIVRTRVTTSDPTPVA